MSQPTEQDMMEFWMARGLKRADFSYETALYIHYAPARAKAEQLKRMAENEKKRDIQRWILSFAIAYYIQKHDLISGVVGGIAGIIASFLGLKAE